MRIAMILAFMLCGTAALASPATLTDAAPPDPGVAMAGVDAGLNDMCLPTTEAILEVSAFEGAAKVSTTAAFILPAAMAHRRDRADRTRGAEVQATRVDVDTRQPDRADLHDPAYSDHCPVVQHLYRS